MSAITQTTFELVNFFLLFFLDFNGKKNALFKYLRNSVPRFPKSRFPETWKNTDTSENPENNWISS